MSASIRLRQIILGQERESFRVGEDQNIPTDTVFAQLNSFFCRGHAKGMDAKAVGFLRNQTWSMTISVGRDSRHEFTAMRE